MIRAILIDLDDTLVRTGGQPLLTESLKLMSARVNDVARPEVFVAQGLAAMQASRRNLDPTMMVGEAFFRDLHERLGCPPQSLTAVFQEFYQSGLGDLRVSIQGQPPANAILDWLASEGYRLVVAADPALHSRLIEQHLHQSGLGAVAQRAELVGALDTMHFSKPNPHYYEELLARIDLMPQEALMVGDEWEADIQAAAQAGLHTFWVTEEVGGRPGGVPSHDGWSATPDGQGSLADLLRRMRDEDWLAGLRAHAKRERGGYTAHLLGTLAAIDSLLREADPGHVTKRRDDDTWSMRDAICHLRDHETEVDQARLRQIIAEDNPFVSATQYDPRAHTHDYQTQDAQEALREFAERRAQTIELLDNLPPEAWGRPARHSIFGPTTLGEMVTFMADHDRIHLRQMQDALNDARQSDA